MKTKLFRQSIRALSKVSFENLSISFDHNKQILLSDVNSDKLWRANELVKKAIILLNEIE